MTMRYEIRHEGRTIAESEYADVAEAAAMHSPVPVGVLDTFTGQMLQVQRPVPSAGLLTEEQLPYSTIDQLIRGNQKIMSIKLIRELTGLGLGDSKQIADRRDAMMREQAEARADADRY